MGMSFFGDEGVHSFTLLVWWQLFNRTVGMECLDLFLEQLKVNWAKEVVAARILGIMV